MGVNEMNGSQQKILDLLKGKSQQMPATFDELLSASNFGQQLLEMMPDAMMHMSPRPITGAIVTKDGVTQKLYWPTGILTGIPAFTINKDKAHAAGFNQETKTSPETAPIVQTAVHEPEPLKEKIVSQSIGIRPAILAILKGRPGMNGNDLISDVLEISAGSTKEKIAQVRDQMAYEKKLCVVGKQANKTYSLPQPVSLSVAAPIPAEKAGASEKPAAPISAPTHPAEPLPTATAPERAPQFQMMLGDDMSLHIGIDDEILMLSPVQAVRLKKFMNRIFFEGIQYEPT
jgi:hypothetical protein